MYHFSEVSTQRLLTCDERIQEVCHEVIQFIDFSVACGHRTWAEQAELYAQGRTKPGRIVTLGPARSVHPSDHAIEGD
jgi:hypothetical protein